MRKRLTIWLLLFMLCCFTTVHADSNTEGLRTWYHSYFFNDSQTSKMVDVINQKKEIAITKQKKEIEEKHNQIRDDTISRIEAYQQAYLSHLKEIENILVKSHFGDYTESKTKEINGNVSQDVADYLADLLVDEEGSFN